MKRYVLRVDVGRKFMYFVAIISDDNTCKFTEDIRDAFFFDTKISAELIADRLKLYILEV